MRSQNLQNRIVELFSIFVAQVKGHTAMGRTDINRIAETVLIPILKEVYGYQDLKNLNDSEGNNNYPAIDLGDETARIAIQVTATSDSEKIKDTLRGFIKNEFYQTYERVQIYILTEKQKSYSGRGFQGITLNKIQFDIKQDILDSRDLLKQITVFQVEQLQRICDILEANFGGSIKLNLPTGIPSNLPRSGVFKFVGRTQKLEELHVQLQQNERLAITAIAGMGGIGKTELALQYAITQLQHQTYPAGLCWLTCRAQEIATQIVSFAKTKLLLTIPDDLEAKEQVDFIWRCWPDGNALIILDDVTDYTAIALYLPPPDPRFKVLLTTRQNFGATVTTINIEELSDEAAIALLKSIVGDERIEVQWENAQALCKWVGNLPLGLELLGRFLVGKPDWAIAKLLERLESKRLDAEALIETESGMTATLGVAAALELSWAELSQPEQDLACLLGMFAVAPIPWYLVEHCFCEVDPEELEDVRDNGLINRSLLKRVGQETYQLHQIIQEYFRVKLRLYSDEGQTLKEIFCKILVKIAKNIDEFTSMIRTGRNPDKFEPISKVIPHLEAVANQWIEILIEDDLIWPFTGVGTFYLSRSEYELALYWFQKCLQITQAQFGNEHLDVARSLNNVAIAHLRKGQYEEAELLFFQSLKIRQKLLGKEHYEIALSLNNLAELYRHQGRSSDTESLYLQALGMKHIFSGKQKSLIISILNNIGLSLNEQSRYDEAEQYFIQSLEVGHEMFGIEHPKHTLTLNNLALAYQGQSRLHESEQCFLRSLEIGCKLIGTDHPDIALILNNLADLYRFLGHYVESESMFFQSLQMRQKFLGQDHPDVATTLCNIGILYQQQGQPWWCRKVVNTLP